jgi:hypothetical protein
MVVPTLGMCVTMAGEGAQGTMGPWGDGANGRAHAGEHEEGEA